MLRHIDSMMGRQPFCHYCSMHAAQRCMHRMTRRHSRFKGVPSHAESIRVLIAAISRVAQAHSPLSATSPTCDIQTPPSSFEML